MSDSERERMQAAAGDSGQPAEKGGRLRESQAEKNCSGESEFACGDRGADEGEPAMPVEKTDAAPDLPAWLLASEDYEPPRDRDGFLRKSVLSLVGVLARMRLDDGQSTRFSPSAPVKLLLGLALILLTSLARNYAFVLVMLALVLVREALLPPKALRRCLGVSLAAAGLTVLVMLPALLLGQVHSALLVGTKVLVTVGIAMTVALSTPTGELTGALRSFHVPNEFIMTVELALKSIVDLGCVALEVLRALTLRSVGHNRQKGASLGGVAGVTFLKAGEAARTTFDAMRCRGFEGDYGAYPRAGFRKADAAWLVGLVLVVILFVYLERAV